MLEAFSNDFARTQPSFPQRKASVGRANRTDVAVKIVSSVNGDLSPLAGSPTAVTRTICDALRTALSAQEIHLSSATTANPEMRSGFLRRLAQSLRPSANLTPSKRLEVALLEFAHRFEERRVLVFVTAGDNPVAIVPTSLLEDARNLDVEVLILAVRATSSGTAATLKQRGFAIEMWDVTESSSRDVADLLCRGILGNRP